MKRWVKQLRCKHDFYRIAITENVCTWVIILVCRKCKKVKCET